MLSNLCELSIEPQKSCEVFSCSVDDILLMSKGSDMNSILFNDTNFISSWENA